MKNLMNSIRLMFCIMLLGIVTCIAASADSKAVLVVFPIDNAAGAENSQVAAKISTRLAEGLKTDGAYEAIIYNPRLASVERLVRTNPQKQISVNGPFSTNAKAVGDAYEISTAMGADRMLVGSLDRCGMSDDSIYQALVTVQLLDVRKKEVIQAITVLGTSAAESGSIDNAAENAADKVIEQITNKKVEGNAETKAANPVRLTQNSRLILLTFGYPANDDPSIDIRNQQASIRLYDGIKKRIIDNKICTVVSYTQSSPPIYRIIKEGKIKAKDVTAPADTTKIGAQKARLLADALGVGYALIGSIDSITADETKASVMTTIQIINAETGKVDSYIAVRGTYTKTAGEDEQSAINKAVDDACVKIIQQLKSQ